MAGTKERPLRVAIVGSGPSGFYAAAALLSSEVETSVHMFEQLAMPYGLVRSGVAPDHAKIKSVISSFEKTAKHSNFRLLCNVEIGKDLSITELRTHFDAIILCYGAATDRRLGIPGEDLLGSHTATEFVGWYNAHPHFRDRKFDLSGKHAVVIGQGNVAVDVSRILAKTDAELKETDIASYALEALSESGLQKISMVGRRGPIQAAFTNKEVRELGELDAVDAYVDPEHLKLSETDQAELGDASGRIKKNLEILKGFAESEPHDSQKQLEVSFFRSPVAILGSNKVEGIRFERNILTGAPGSQRAEGSGEYEEIPCDLVFRSIGYRGFPMPGVPFDESRGLIPNEAGRVLAGDKPLVGAYVAGWIKRGPSGIIGTNKADSNETVASLLGDLDKLPEATKRSDEALLQLLETRGVRVISYQDWQRIDEAEIARGKELGKVREKFVELDSVLSFLATS